VICKKRNAIKNKDKFFITVSLKFSTLFITLNLRGNDYGKNILESTVIRSTTSSEGVDNYYLPLTWDNI
jgi:hypothetical protein